MAAPAASLGQLLVIGELCVDLIVEVGDEIRFGQHEQIVQRTSLTLGSSSAITACGAAALGVPTRLVSVRGDDTFGRFLDAELTARRVDTSGVRIDKSLPTGASTHLTRATGDRAILTSLGSIGTVTARDLHPEDFAAAMHLHLGSYFLQYDLHSDAPALFAAARAAGLSTSLDGNFDPDECWDSGILDLMPYVDVFFANEQELTCITRTADIPTAVGRLLTIMPKSAVVVAKLGADGAVAVRRDERVRATIPALESPLVDTVGAGDTLAAGFLAARMRQLPLADALAIAVACGTASTRGSGGVGAQPDFDAARALASQVTLQSESEEVGLRWV